MTVLVAVAWTPDGAGVRIIDQRSLPEELVHRDLRSLDEVVDAIQTLAVRGAPAIGVTAAIGLVASLIPFADGNREDFARRLALHAGAIRSSRPTAVNLPWALDRLLRCAARRPPSSRRIG
ncbi:MAG: hypothetical protein NVS4B3_05580 [Gemmatimonadaceae bacterium]